MKYSIKKYTRRRCYNKNKKKSSKRRNIKKHYSRRRIALHKKSKMRKQRKTKKMYQYGGVYRGSDGYWYLGDPPTDATAAAAEDMEESMNANADADADAAADAAADASATAAAAQDGISDDQVPSANGETTGDDGDYYIDVPLSPTGFLDAVAVDDDVEVSKEELLRIFREFPDVLSSIGISPQGAATKADDVVQNIEQKALCGECSPGSACVFDRPKQNQLYGKLLEMIFAILVVSLRGNALSTFFDLGPCVPYDIPHTLTMDTRIPELYRNCAISVKTLLDTEIKLSRRETPSTGRIACGDAVIFLESLIYCLNGKITLKMVVIDYFLKKNVETGRTSSVVPRIMAVYNLTENWQLIFGRNDYRKALASVDHLKKRIANAQDPLHSPAVRKKVLSDIRRDVKIFNVWMANGDGGLCCAYKQSKKADTVTDGPKQQLRLQVSIVVGSVKMQPKDYKEWQDLDYKGPQTITGIQPEDVKTDPFPAQPLQTPKATDEKETARKRIKKQMITFATSVDDSAPVKPSGASVKPTIGKKSDSSDDKPKRRTGDTAKPLKNKDR